MDPHARWLRRLVLRRVAARTAAAVALFGGLGSAALIVLGVDPMLAIPWALLATQLLVGAQVANTALRGVVNRRYLEDYVGRPIPVRHEPMATCTDAAVEQTLGELGLRPASLLTVDAVTDDSGEHGGPPAYELFAAGDRSVLVMRGCAGGATVVLSALADGRILVTSDLLVVPASLLVTNYCPGRPLPVLVARHRRVISVLSGHGLGVAAASPALGAEFLRREQSALAEVGSWVVPFLSFTGSAPFPALTVAVRPADLRRLAIRTRGPHPVRRPSTGTPAADTPVALPPVEAAAGAAAAGSLNPSLVNR